MSDPDHEAEHAFANAERGDGRAARALRRAWEGSDDPRERGWAAALRAQHLLLEGGESSAGADDILGVAADSYLCATRCRLALAGLDRTSLAHWIRCWDTLQLDASGRVQRALARHALEWLNGAGTVSLEALLETSGEARRCALPGPVVESQALIALAALSSGDAPVAVRSARRASRMARTEGLIYPEILANLVLARVRRHQNAPHLALRIAQALGRHAPFVWRGWLAWEMGLSGGNVSLPRPEGPLERAAAVLGHLVSTLAREEPRPRAALARLRTSVLDNPVLEGDTNLLVGAFDPTADCPDLATRAWRAGERDAPPAGTAGLVFYRAGQLMTATVCWAYVAEQDGVRVAARFPDALIATIVEDTGAHIVGPQDKAKTRLETGLATLAFAAEGLDTNSYFERVYGYPFEREVHWSVLNTHIHRLRSYVGDHAAIIRDDDRLRLDVTGPIIIRDPRSRELIGQRALRVLASLGRASAKELAVALGVPLRTVQRVVADLVEDDTVSHEKVGRVVVYAVEDTTFSEATASRSFVAPFSVAEP